MHGENNPYTAPKSLSVNQTTAPYPTVVRELTSGSSQPNGPFTRRIQEHLGRLQQAKAVAAAQEAESRKRALSGPQNEPAKRAKVTEVVAAPLAVPTPPPPPPPVTGPMTLGEVFTLTPDAALSTFDAQQLPLDMVIKITIAALYSVNQQVLEQSVAVSRLLFIK